jgi:hypothetical protein
MREIKDTEEITEIRKFVNLIKKKQMELEETETQYVLYSPISLNYALKNKILIANFLTHPLILIEKLFHDDYAQKNEEEILELTKKILEYEFTEKVTYLEKVEIDRIIKFLRKLEKKIFKKKEL